MRTLYKALSTLPQDSSQRLPRSDSTPRVRYDARMNPRITHIAAALQKASHYLSQDCLGGPRPWRLAWVINAQKAGTAAFVWALMVHYQNFSPAAWVYLALHGSYGAVWLLKDLCFPDRSWQARVTVMGGVNAFLGVLGWYWFIAYLLISRAATPSYPLPEAAWFVVCISLCIVGSVLMIAADAQKFYTLRLQRGLITDGVHAWVRHPNYLGEMMIYASFGLLAWHWAAAVILGCVWGFIFAPNMVMKEASMARYPEWADYKARTGWLLPRLFKRP